MKQNTTKTDKQTYVLFKIISTLNMLFKFSFFTAVENYE